MQLIIVHYHLRPGGVRRVIELATPHLARALAPVERVLLATGEGADDRWTLGLAQSLAPVPLECRVEPDFRYAAEQTGRTGLSIDRIAASLRRMLTGATAENTVVWAHNLGLARNLPLARELARACGARGIALVSHHHDWWFDNRWPRWSEMRRAGVGSLAAVAGAIFPPAASIRHAAINRADARMLARHFGRRSGWLPNLAARELQVSSARRREARAWLTRQLGAAAPVWLMPCRLLRRKNVAEALLLTRWLRPEAWLVTTGGVTSSDEQAYADRLAAAARAHGWPLRLAVLAGDEATRPPVPALLAASECCLLTSVQEGFGLPYLEAAAAHRPLIARALVNIDADLTRFGFRFPQYYGDVLVPTELFDWRAEVLRQTRLFRAWKSQLPAAWRQFAGEPLLLRLKSAGPVPFSQLTLSAQLEVLAHPPADSWAAARLLNPSLGDWRRRAQAGKLRVAAWPASADAWLSGEAYARRFVALLGQRPRKHLTAAVSRAAQADFIRWKLGAEWLYPLLWSSRAPASSP